MLEWDPIQLATADLISLSLYRNGQKAGNIPRPLQMHSTKISGLAVDTEYTFHLVLRTSAGTYTSERMQVRTHKMTDLSGVTITTGIMPGSTKEHLVKAVERIGAKIVDGVRIDTTHFVTTEGRGQQWEKAVESNIPVVRPEWVDACEKTGRILGVTKFYLDAMKPGPPSEERVAPTPTPVERQKELPQTPPQEPETPKPAEKAPVEAKKPEESNSDNNTSEEEPEQKAKTEQQVEQKVRFEDKEEQKIALRPKEEDSSKPGEQGPGEQGSPSAKLEVEEDDKDKTSTTPDGASFQEVEL